MEQPASQDPLPVTSSLADGYLSDPRKAVFDRKIAFEKSQQNQDLDLLDHVKLFGESISNGLVTGAFNQGPEMFLRGFRTLADATGFKDGVDFASRNIKEFEDARKFDPFYKVDPRIMNNEFYRSINQGLSSTVASLEAAAPGVLAGILTGGTGFVALAGGAAVSGGSLAGLAEYDSFLDEAQQTFRQDNIGITRDEVKNLVGDNALWSAFAEGGFEFASNFLEAKIVGAFGKPAAKAARTFADKLLRTVIKSAAVEVPSELLTAVAQDNLRADSGLNSVGGLAALKQAFGPALVSAIVMGAGGTTLNQVTGRDAKGAAEFDNKALEDSLNKTIADAESLTAAAGQYADLLEKTGVGKEDAISQAKFAEQQAFDWADANGKTPADWWDMMRAKGEAFGLDAAPDLPATDAQSVPAFLQALAGTDPKTAIDRTLDVLRTELTPEDGNILDSIGDTEVTMKELKTFISRNNRLSDKFVRVLESDVSQPSQEQVTGVFKKMKRRLTSVLGSSSSLGMIPADFSQKLQAEITGDPKLDPPMFGFTDESITPERRVQVRESLQKSMENDTIPRDLPDIGLNTRTMNIPEDAKDLVRQIDSLMQQDTENTLDRPANTFKAVSDKARREFMDSGNFAVDAIAELFQLENTVKNQNVLVTKAKATYTMVLTAAHNAAKTAISDPSSANKGAAVSAIEVLLKVHNSFRGVTSGVARSLGVLRAPGLDMTSFNDKLGKIYEAANTDGAADLKIAAFINFFENGGKMNDFAKKVAPSLAKNTYDAIIEGITASLLTNPSTQVANLLGNATMLFEHTWNRVIAATVTRADNGVTVGETRAALYGLVSGFFPGINNALTAFKRNESQIDPKVSSSQELGLGQTSIAGSNFTRNAGLSKSIDLVGKTLNLGTRTMLAQDDLVKTMSFNMEKQGLLHREGSRLQEKIGGSLGDAIKALDSKTLKDIDKRAMTTARYLAFQTDLGKIGKLADGLRRSVPGGMIVMPFLKTPVSIAKVVGERTPFIQDFMKNHQEEINSSDPAIRSIAQAREFTGNILWTTAFTLAGMGLFTGTGPGSPEDKRKLMETGWRPNSLHVGDTYVEMSRLDPLAFFFTTAANIAESVNELDDADLASAMGIMVGAGINSARDRSFLQGVTELFDVVSNPSTSALKRYIKNRATMFVPGSAALRGARNTIDPYVREADGVIAGIMNILPGVSEALPNRKTFLGDNFTNGFPAYSALALPFKIGTRKGDKVAEELSRLSLKGTLSAPRPSRFITSGDKRVQLSAENRSRLAVLFGQGVKIGNVTLKEFLTAFIGSPQYESLTDEERSTTIDTAVRQYKRKAKNALIEEDHSLRSRLSKQGPTYWSFVTQ